MFKDKIKELRQAKGLTQEQLAEKSGLSRSMLSHIELGTKTPSSVALGLLADALDCSADYLLGRLDK